MSAVLIQIDPTSPEPPFAIEKVYIAKGSTELPKDSIETKRLIMCLTGSAEVRIKTEEIETFHLNEPSVALLVDVGSEVISVGGTDNVSTVIFSGE